jgi:hypothetical protein
MIDYLPLVGSSKKIIEGFEASSTAMDNLKEKRGWKRL